MLRAISSLQVPSRLLDLLAPPGLADPLDLRAPGSRRARQGLWVRPAQQDQECQQDRRRRRDPTDPQGL